MDRRLFLGSAVAVAGGLGARGAVANEGGAAKRDAVVDLARYLATARFDDLPEAALAVTRAQLIDTVAAGLAGRAEDGVRQLRDISRETMGKGESALWGSSLRVPAHEAARINTVAVHALEFDDTFGRGFLHPSAIVFPAALAITDMVGGIDGRTFLAATTLAVDIACRLSVACQPGVDGFSTGWHNTTLIGYPVTAMLAARLMKLDADRIANAAGIACHQAGGTAQSHIDSALTKRLGPGLASGAGVLAARLAARGVTGPRGVLEGAKGFFQQYHRGHYSRALLLDGLGTAFPAAEMSFKPFPSCRGSHTSADAALQVAAESGLRPGEIARVVVRNGPAEWPFLCDPIARKRRPATVVEAQFSIPWVVAAALTDRKLSIGHFTQAALGRDDIRAMADKITAMQDDRLRNPRGGPGQAVVELTARDGRVFRQHVAAAKGDPEAPMSRAETEAKFADCTGYAGMPRGRAQALRAMLERVDALDDMSRLSAAMTMPG